ncbi:hypothetical protein [Anditalea andensis]|nr:hypothetical protein [Anditalea andensis]
MMKNFKLSGWILTLIYIPFLCSCEKDEIECLPYEGEIFPVSYKGLFGMSCNGIVIKVTNTSVNSFFEWEGVREENIITVRIPNGMGFEEVFGFPIDENIAGQRFYFDFRELLPEEFNVCTMEYAEPTKLVYMTDFSLIKCNGKQLNNITQ